MSLRIHRRSPLPILVLGSLFGATGLPGCGGPAAEPAKPIPIANASADNELKNVTLDNEADHMKLLKEKTKAGPAPKSLGPALPPQSK